MLLLALEEYFNEPTPTVLKRLHDSINAIDLSLAPLLTLDERLVLRNSERKDLFEEKIAFLEDASVMLGDDGDDSSSSAYRRSMTPLASSSMAADESLSADDFAPYQAPGHLSVPSGLDFSPRARVASDTSAVSGFSSASTPSTGAIGMQRQGSNFSTHASRNKGLRDTHYYDTSVSYNGLTLPIRYPLGTFPEEVGDVCHSSC